MKFTEDTEQGKKPEHTTNVAETQPSVINTESGKNAIRKYRKHSIHSNNYSVELTDRICELVANGESITKICQRKALPSVYTLYDWMEKYPEFKNKYQLARARKAHALVESALDAHKEALDKVDSMDPTDKRCNAIVQAYKLKSDVNLKVAGLYNKQEYGDAPFIAAPAQIGVQVVFGECVSPSREVEAEVVESKVVKDDKQA